MKLKPYFARVLIERELKEKVGSILIPENIRKIHAACVGKVVDVGPSADPGIEVGQTVMFGQHAGAWLDKNLTPLSDEMAESEGAYFILQDEDLWGEVTDG